MTLKHAAALFMISSLTVFAAHAQTPAATLPPQKVIIDTDIGDDIDDVFALGLALASPELDILGISSAWGDTALRSRMIDRLLCETGRDSTPSLVGISKTASGAGTFSQQPWAAAGIDHPHGDAVGFLLEQISLNPGQITLIAIGPLTNIGAAIDRDAATFRKLNRVVIMGGSVNRGYDDSSPGSANPTPPSAEYNIAMDPAAAQKLFRSGVPIYMMPLDSTQIRFDEVKRSQLASTSTPLTDAIQVLTAEYTRATRYQTPTLFDVVAAAYAIDPNTCPATSLHIEVDDQGYTRVQPGTPNAQACLKPQEDALFQLLMPRLLTQHLVGIHACLDPRQP